jgi:hypothetical protein
MESEDDSRPRITPFCLVPDGPAKEAPAATQAMVNKMGPPDADENIFTVLVYDHTLLDVIDFFPISALNRKAKGWGQQAHWRVLAPLKGDRRIMKGSHV